MSNSLSHMTTKEFVNKVKSMGLKLVILDTQMFIESAGVQCGGIHIYKQYSFWVDTDSIKEELVTPFVNALACYAHTPISEREPNTYKLNILDTNLYLIHINKYETTITTNKKAAKAYDDAGIYDAKVFAEKQGFTLRAEAINAAN